MIAPIQPPSSARVPVRHDKPQASEQHPAVAHATNVANPPNRIVGEIKLCVQRNPGAAVAVAAGLGVVVGWVWKRWR